GMRTAEIEASSASAESGASSPRETALASAPARPKKSTSKPGRPKLQAGQRRLAANTAPADAPTPAAETASEAERPHRQAKATAPPKVASASSGRQAGKLSGVLRLAAHASVPASTASAPSPKPGNAASRPKSS